MSKVTAFLLVLGAFVGLFGQQAAYAAGPSWSALAVTMLEANTASDVSDCMKVMSDDSDRPCKSRTLDCIARGCGVPITLNGAQPVVAEQTVEQNRPCLRPISPLTGRMVPPEPRPPAALI